MAPTVKWQSWKNISRNVSGKCRIFRVRSVSCTQVPVGIKTAPFKEAPSKKIRILQDWTKSMRITGYSFVSGIGKFSLRIPFDPQIFHLAPESFFYPKTVLNHYKSPFNPWYVLWTPHFFTPLKRLSVNLTIFNSFLSSCKWFHHRWKKRWEFRWPSANMCRSGNSLGECNDNFKIISAADRQNCFFLRRFRFNFFEHRAL